MKMKQYVCLALALVLLMSLFSACGGQGEETMPSSTETESITKASTEAGPEATTEPTETPTEPLPTEILSWEQDGFYIGDSVRTYDRQGNLIKEEKDFRYEDGRTEVGYTCYTADGVIIEECYTECFPDGTLKSFSHLKYDEAGTCIYREIESYYDNKELREKELKIYDPEKGVWNATSEWYREDGTPDQLLDGVLESRDGGLIEGFVQYYYEDGSLYEDCQKNADGSGYCYYYYKDGSPSDMTDDTFDAETNTLKSINLKYDQNGTITYHSESEETLDANGNLIKDIHYSFDESNVYSGKSVAEYQYNTDDRVIWQSRNYYDSDGNDEESDEYFFKYNLEGRLVEKTKIIDWGDFLSTTDYTYEYNIQGLVSKMNVVDSDTRGYNSEQFYEYEYNEQGLRIQEYMCDPYADIRGDTETYTTYTYDENENCILVEVVKFVDGELKDYKAFESDGSGYIYGEYGTQLYPYADPLNDY